MPFPTEEAGLSRVLTVAPGATLFARFLHGLHRHDWVVYAKKPFGGPEQVLQYLARYTHRVAISNHRLLGMDDGKVTFRWKDYAHGGKQRKMTLAAEEFIRRFLLHVLPKGFVRIRHFGWMANRCRRERAAQCRALLDEEAAQPATIPASALRTRQAVSLLRRGSRGHRDDRSPRVITSPAKPKT